MSRLGLIAGWLLVTGVTTFVAWQIVAAADATVSDRPLSVATASNAVESTAPQESPTTTVLPSDTTRQTLPPSTSSTTTVSSVSTSTPETTTTSAAEPWTVKTISTSGGTVVISYRPGEVKFESAAPAPGYSVEIEHRGPPKVEVEFESPEHTIEVKAEWKDGELSVDVDGEE